MSAELKQLPPKDAMREFQDRVVEDLKGKMGEMLPDEALKELVKRAVEEQFFKPRIESDDDSWSPRKVEKPSWFVAEVTKQAAPHIQQLIKEHVEANKEDIQKAVAQFLETQNLLLLTFAALKVHTMQDFMEMANTIIARMKQPY